MFVLYSLSLSFHRGVTPVAILRRPSEATSGHTSRDSTTHAVLYLEPAPSARGVSPLPLWNERFASWEREPSWRA